MREAGFEPARAEAHKILSLARLPIPPLPPVSAEGYVASTHRQVKDLSALSGQLAAFSPERPRNPREEEGGQRSRHRRSRPASDRGYADG